MYKIQLATLADVPTLTEYARDFITFYNVMEFDAESVSVTLTHVINTGCVYIATLNDDVIAAIGGVCATNPWNRTQAIWQEMFWWVFPKYRNTFVGIKLLKLFEQAAPTNSTISLSILPQTDLKQETLAKLNYKLVEQTYIKE